MKKQLLLLVLMMPLVVSAHDIAVKNADGIYIYYNYTNNGTELAVTFNGSSANYDSNRYTGNLIIPNEVTYMNRIRKVTSISSQAFSGCNGLTTVTIPNNVMSIGSSAFYGCSRLNKVIVSDIAVWCGIKFAGKTANPLYYARHLYSDENTEITNLVIPNSVTSIGDYTFYLCSGLTSVIIGNGVTTIGSHAFYCCTNLSSVTIGNGVTSIGDNAFVDCVGLTTVTIPNSVTSIGDNAFFGCSALTSVTIGNSVRSIGSGAFRDCLGLTSVTIPNSVTSIGNQVFDGVNIPTIISLIENPFIIQGKTSKYRTFTLNTFNNATLYVPKGTIEKYKATSGWCDFIYIEESGTPPTPENCEKPTISYVNGKLTFSSSTEGATCYYSITDSDIKAGSGSEVQLGVTYNISAYASKAGYKNSETATATLCWIDAVPQTEGITNGVTQIAARPVLIKTDNGFITVEGTDDRTNVSIYTTDGKQLGSAISQNNVATIATRLRSGSIAIVKVGEKSVKVMLK